MKSLVFALTILVGAAGAAAAQPTPMVIRVIAKGAKFIGTEVGGVAITLTDADTGQVLAKGIAQGGAGTTTHIMKDSHLRGDILSNDTTAQYSVSLDLDHPIRVTATATGPAEPPGGATNVSATQWVLPGKGVAGGDGWVLEMPGFLISPLDTPTDVHAGTGAIIPLHVKVTMMCGCPITPGGQWDADKFELLATVARNGRTPVIVPLIYAGKSSEFTAQLPVHEAGDYQITVTAFDPANGNTGLDRILVTAK